MPEHTQIDGSVGSAPEPDSPGFIDHAALSEDLALSQLSDRDLTPEALEHLSRDTELMKSRKVRIALASHPHTPRRIALRLIRELYSFELLQFSQLPTAAADLKRVADELLISRLASVTLGERTALARRC